MTAFFDQTDKKFSRSSIQRDLFISYSEECGEVASEVNHFEGSGIKRLKHGEPDKNAMAGEIKQALAALMRLSIYYSVQDEPARSIDASLDRIRAEKLID